MVNACNVTVPYQTACSLVVEKKNNVHAMGAVEKKKKVWDENNQGSLCNIHVLSKKKRKLLSRHCAPSILSAVWGMCGRKTAIIFQFPLLSSCLIFPWPTTRTANCASGLKPASGVRDSRGGFISIFVGFPRETRTVALKTLSAFTRRDPLRAPNRARRLEAGHVGTVKKNPKTNS